jgi:hypothetical protein
MTSDRTRPHAGDRTLEGAVKETSGHTRVAGDVDDASEAAQQLQGRGVQPRAGWVDEQRGEVQGSQVQALQPAMQ